ncbi:host specificity protein J [Moraxella bovis]|nr:host specificity protein J [Moraxella bovis]
MMIHGAKKKQPQPHRPHIAKDDLVSVERYQGLYGLCEGEIFGLADGGRSIRLDGTPLINDNGQANFTDVSWEFRTGTNDQSYIKGFASVENETAVGVELRHDRPFVRAINNKDLSAVRVRLNFNALRQQHDNGDITGYGIEYAIDVQTDGGAFVQMLRTSARGKASSGFKRSHRIDLPKGKTWTIRVRRITPNRNSDLIADTMYIDALTEIIDAKLRYPNTALLALTYNAKTFSNIAKIAVRLKGKLIQVPSNYDPTARTYFGLWDGTFKLAYSNNPAWVFYDLCTHKRYGLGERLNGMVDKWRLYQIAQYCDEMVDDGQGGREPRFAINVYIQKADDAYRVLQNIASVFRGLSFWDGSQIVLDSDTPKDPVYTFIPANIVGEFVYQGTRSRDRHTVAKVAWDNPEHDYATEYEMVREESAIAKYGIRTLDINAFGCTSRGQAQRAGLWALKAEQLETRTVNFKTGLMGFIPQVGQIINIADNLFAGRAISGRILSVNDTQITLDRTAGKVGDTLTINTDGTVKTAKIVSVHGDTLTLDTAVGQADDVWAIISDDLKLMQFRVLSIVQNNDATFDITALQYERQKYDVVDNGAVVTPQPYTVLKATPCAI